MCISALAHRQCCQEAPDVCRLALLGGGSGGSIDAAVPYSSSTFRMMLSTLSRSFLDGPSTAGAGGDGALTVCAASSNSSGPLRLLPDEMR